jgi:predicted DNA-binding protein YlxM (UPF0122 family)
MLGLFGGGIHQNFSLAMFQQMPRRDQDVVLQQLYDQNYSVPEISRFTGISAPTLYSRINAHRGRGHQLAT